MKRLNYTNEQLIADFRKIHGDKYNYSKVELTRFDAKVTIICPKHGEFLQCPSKHLQGRGCPRCAIECRPQNNPIGKEEFIRRAKLKHGNLYDYSKVEYVNAHTKVNIVCPIHGIFSQKANDHLNGHGCPLCQISTIEKEVELLLQSNKISYMKQWHLPWYSKMSIDFYIPDKNIGIECQGIQHFQPVQHFGGDVEYKLVANRDKKKKDSCAMHGIQIIYYANYNYSFPYEVITNQQQLIEKIQNAQINGSNDDKRGVPPQGFGEA